MLWVVLGTGITVLPFSIAQFTVRDGWMVSLFYFLGICLAAAVGVWFIKTFPNQSLMNGFETAFGPWIGRAIGIWLLIWVFIHNSLLLRELSVFVEITSLPRTPLYIISGVVIIPLSYAVFHGLEVSGRVAEFLTPVAVIFILVLTVLSLQNVHLSQLRPILADGWTPVLRASVLPSTSFAFQLLISLQFAQSLNKDGKTFGRDLLLVGAFLSVGGIVLEGIIITVVGASSTYLSLPVREVVQGIRIGQFVERLDTVYVMGVMATMVVKNSVFLYAMSSMMMDMFRLPSTKHVVWPAGAAIWTGNILLFHNSPDLHEFMVYTSPAYYGFTFIVLPLMAILVHRSIQAMRRARRA